MKPPRVRFQRKQEDGQVLETVVEFKDVASALGFFNGVMKKCGGNPVGKPPAPAVEEQQRRRRRR